MNKGIKIFIGAWFIISGLYAFTQASTTYAIAGGILIVVGVVILSRMNKSKKTPISDTSVNNTVQQEANQDAKFITNGDAHNNINPNNESENNQLENHYVAGTSYKREEIESLGMLNDDYTMSKKDFIDIAIEDDNVYEYDFAPIDVKLIEEPENEHDKNAVKVIIDGVHVGYIKAGSCSHIKKLISSDRIKSISAEIKGGKYKRLSLDDDGKYLLEKDEINYSIILVLNLK